MYLLPFLLASTAAFNCLEVQDFIDNIPRDDLSPIEYRDLVDTFKDFGPRNCIYHIIPQTENNLANCK